MADLVRDSNLLTMVQQAADQLLEQYREVVPALIKRWLGNSVRYGQV